MSRRIMLAFAAMVLTAAPGMAQAQSDSVDALARDVARLESLREVKDVQRNYSHYAEFGLWSDMADLFADQGRIVWGDRAIEGRATIAQWLQARGGGRHGLAPGALNLQLIDDPLANLSADGNHAQVRWRGLALMGDGKGRAWMEGGTYENDYVRENGRWKIATLHFHPQYEGDYADGWSNIGQQDLPIVPYHFTVDSAGTPIPPSQGAAPASGATLTALAPRIAALNDEDDVRNLQGAYGYYVDRKMWDDVTDLFANDAVIEIDGVGTFKGKAGVRAMLARMGPAGLAHGELNDWLQFDTIVTVAPGGREAFARGTELAMLGQADKGEASWQAQVFRNRFVKEGGLWKIREMRIEPMMKADYHSGWGRGALAGSRSPAMPALLGENPATGKPIAGKDLAIFAAQPLTGAIAPGAPPKAKTLTDARRRYMRSLAYEGTLNVSAAYGYYIDDSRWDEMGALFAVKGNKQSPFAGYYFGRDRIAAAAAHTYGPAKDAKTYVRAFIPFHWRIQPVILVSHDGRSSTQRTYLFHPNTGKYDKSAGQPNRAGTIQTGMYPNDQFVLEDGIWRMWSVTIDEPYYDMPNWQGGWSAAKEPPAGQRPPASPLMQRYPPDIPITALGKREEGFRGGVGTTITWPGILPMWFHYRNPVSGRVPELYWPDCVPCTMRPDASMTKNGYEMPPTGPQRDGVDLR